MGSPAKPRAGAIPPKRRSRTDARSGAPHLGVPDVEREPPLGLGGRAAKTERWDWARSSRSPFSGYTLSQASGTRVARFSRHPGSGAGRSRDRAPGALRTQAEGAPAGDFRLGVQSPAKTRSAFSPEGRLRSVRHRRRPSPDARKKAAQPKAGESPSPAHLGGAAAKMEGGDAVSPWIQADHATQAGAGHPKGEGF